MKQNEQPIKLIHYLPGRLRLELLGLRDNPQLAAQISQAAGELKGVYQVQASTQTGRLLILFDESLLQLSEIVHLLLGLIPITIQPGEPPYTGDMSRARRPQEPEDLPLGQQIFNVALGGGVLAYLGLKHWLVGRTPLAEHPQLFNLAAVTTIVSGYPVLCSGLQGLARGRVNYDLVLSALAIGTSLARESVPGLTVMFLTNLAALAQTLVLKRYLQSLPRLSAGERISGRHQGESTKNWRRAGEEYAQRSILPVLGMATLTGLTGGAGGLQKTLAMLLAANPSPAGLAAPTAAAAMMAGASKKGILYRNPEALATLGQVDTVIFDDLDVITKPTYQLGEILPMPGVSKRKVLALLAMTRGETELAEDAIKQALLCSGYGLEIPERPNLKVAEIVVGNEEVLLKAGIATVGARFKVRRIEHLQQVPLYVAYNGQLAGLVGLKQIQHQDLDIVMNQLHALGLAKIGLILNEEDPAIGQAAQQLGIGQIWIEPSIEGKEQCIRSLQQQGHRVALVVGRKAHSTVANQADVTIGVLPNAAEAPATVDVLIPEISILSEAIQTSLQGEQRVRQNVTLVQVANALGLVLASTGRLAPMAAKVYGDLVAIAVCTNSFRLLAGSSKSQNRHNLSRTQQETAAALEEALQPGGLSTGSLCHSWHSMSVAEALHKLGTDLNQGLEQGEVARRRSIFGPNRMAEEKPQSFFSRLWGQLKDFLVKTLMASAVVCALLGELGDALAILSILALNAILGAMQEQKAEGALQALGQMTAPTAKVRRGDQVERVQASHLVPGDIVLLEQGDGVPADLRILEAYNLEIEESALTGESYPVAKVASQLSDCVPLLDCENLAFMGTHVTRGRAVGVVTATGMATEIGKIAGMLHNQTKDTTPLQNRMADVGRIILKYCLGVSGLVVLAGILRGGSIFKMFLTGVSLAVAAIPEGLPAVVTIALASGVRRMAKENAVVRHLPAVETLGSATLICTDKTGTLTQNRQQVLAAYTGSGWWWSQKNQGLKPEEDQQPMEEKDWLLTAGILCNNANLQWSQTKSAKGKPHWQVEGDPTEGALLLAGIREDFNYKGVREEWQRIKELPFDAERLRMTVICQGVQQGAMSFVKGAPEVVLGLCTQLKKGQEVISLQEENRQEILKANERLTGEAMRVLAVAYKPVGDPEESQPEEELIFLGLVGMVDPPRPEVRQAIATCHAAGIKVAMITGDHPHTALAIAKEVGICKNNLVLTGRQIDSLSDLELAAALREVRVFARVLPAQKLRLVQTYRRQGVILAMVGDGINDAPAVKEADIGVAMGQAGTDVTKQAADIVLTDDNFATLVSAIHQGRGIYNNIRRSVRYLLATNVGLVLLVFATVLFGLTMPLLPIQLLFLNVLGDGLPALALGVEPTTKAVMQQPPRPAEQSFFADGLSTQIISRGLATGLVGLETYRRILQEGDLGRARTIALASFIAGKLLFALECGEKEADKGKTTNAYLLGSVALSALLLVAAIYLPLGRRIFKTSFLGLRDVGTVLGASGLTYLVEKFITVLWQRQQLNRVESRPA